MDHILSVKLWRQVSTHQPIIAKQTLKWTNKKLTRRVSDPKHVQYGGGGGGGGGDKTCCRPE